MNNPYCPVKGKIIDIKEETSNIKTFRLNLDKNISFKTGQFIELTVPGIGEAPFTPSSNPKIEDTMDVTIMKVGRVTEILHGLKPGDEIAVRGPYGMGYPLKEFEGKEILIVGGGVGLAPLRSLILALLNDRKKYKKLVVKYGSRTPKDIVYKDLLREWANNKDMELEITVDAGDETWKGNVGLITTLIKRDMGVDVKNSVAIVCGPPIMMKFSTFKLIDIGYEPRHIYLSMEKNMSCGIGKCGHCRIGPYYACKDGPVFTYDKISGLHGIWE
ncbi:MAG: FAD/NAD(P)-binding protein [Candidatus Omnitrophica bacterium]|nr:FAD/NAD(P)-binding protein [Candidatus Omnitrophota bacterium]MBU4487501.1 FAD/NAD(P)-binding protein [Candidatus Omnitrophota bacterium]